MLNFEELYKPYSKMASLDETLSWLFKQAASLKIDRTITELAISEVFLEMSKGKTFPIDGGDTGFTGVPHAVLNHYLLKRTVDINTDHIKAARQLLEERLRNALEIHTRQQTTWTERNLPTFKGVVKRWTFLQ